jgi:hypothetical protein
MNYELGIGDWELGIISNELIVLGLLKKNCKRYYFII